MAVRNTSWLVLLLLAGCASGPEPAEVFVSELAAALAGSYDNMAQARAGEGHVALRLVIAPVRAPLVADHVFYVQEMAADDARRVQAQRLYVLHPADKGERALLVQADFAEISRWRDGHLNRDLFKSLLPQDLRPRAGCDLLVERDGRGFKATGGTACRVSAPGTGETLRVEQRFELDADGLAVFEQQRDAAGTLVRGAGADAWYRYARRADAPW